MSLQERYRWETHMFLIEKHSKLSECHYLEPSLYPSIPDFVEATNTLTQEKHNHHKIFITVKLSQLSRKTESFKVCVAIV